VQFARQLADASVEFGFERRQSCFGSIESLLRRIGGRNADLGEARGLLPERGNGLLVNPSEARPLALDNGLELLHPIRGVFLDPGGGRLPLGDVRFELRDRARVPLDGQRPPFQVRVVLIGKRDEPFLDRYAAVIRFESEPIQLRLHVRQTQFQVTDAQWHGGFGVA